MNSEEYQEYIRSINQLLDDTDKINAAYQKESRICYVESTNFFGDDLLQPLKLCDATTLFLIMAFVNNHPTSDKKLIAKMHLIAAYEQGFDVSTGLILEGNYIKASGTIKQDFEMIVRLNAIHDNKDKPGKSPNAQNGPASYKDMYGYLNNIAHISKEDILNFILTHKENGQAKGISHIKKFNKIIAHRLMTYTVAIKVEMLRQTLNFYLELAGEDKIHQKGLVYYQLIIAKYQEVGMME
jgi:hypothetical protein